MLVAESALIFKLIGEISTTYCSYDSTFLQNKYYKFLFEYNEIYIADIRVFYIV